MEWQLAGNYGVHLMTWNAGAVYANIVSTAGTHHVLISSPGVIAANEYQHLALRYDQTSGLGSLFVNGLSVAELNFGTFTPRTDTELRIGFRPNTTPFGPLPFLGQIDEVTLYNSALSNDDMLALAAVPEPATGTLILIGVGGWLGRLRFYKR